jgi:hypothetical protein
MFVSLGLGAGGRLTDVAFKTYPLTKKLSHLFKQIQNVVGKSRLIKDSFTKLHQLGSRAYTGLTAPIRLHPDHSHPSFQTHRSIEPSGS